MIESGIRRIGLEQEMFFVNRAWRPAPVALEVLEEAEGPFMLELALFNREANIEPRTLDGHCFSDLEKRIDEVVSEARRAAKKVDSGVILTGILLTLTKSDMSFDNIIPKSRYYALRSAHATRIAKWLPGVAQDPNDPDVLRVDRTIARLFALQFFHLLGFRSVKDEGDTLVVRRRRFDEARFVARRPNTSASGSRGCVDGSRWRQMRSNSSRPSISPRSRSIFSRVTTSHPANPQSSWRRTKQGGGRVN